MNEREAMRKLGISYNGIYRAAVKRGSLKFKSVGKQREYDIEDIREYANRKGKGTRTKSVTRKFAFPVNQEEQSRTMQIYDPTTDTHTLLTQCRCCKKFKTKIYQFQQCAECLNPKFVRLIAVINDVRSLA